MTDYGTALMAGHAGCFCQVGPWVFFFSASPLDLLRSALDVVVLVIRRRFIAVH